MSRSSSSRYTAASWSEDESVPSVTRHSYPAKSQGELRHRSRNYASNKHLLRQYNLAISECVRKKDWCRAVHLLEEMSDQHIVPNAVSYNAVISACGAAKEWREALATFRRMQASGVTPNPISYSAVMSACTGSLQWVQALKIFDEMLSSPVKPNEVTFTSAIVACGGLNEWRMAVACLRHMEERGLTPNVITYSAAISACQSEPAIALDLLEEMQSRGIQPNIITMNSVLTACDTEHREVALCVLQQLLDCGMTPNPSTHTALQKIFGNSHQVLMERGNHRMTRDIINQSGGQELAFAEWQQSKRSF